MSLYSHMRWRYVARQLKTACLVMSRAKPLFLPAITMLAARRLTSHSQGPGSVLSKSLRSKTWLRSRYSPCESSRHDDEMYMRYLFNYKQRKTRRQPWDGRSFFYCDVCHCKHFCFTCSRNFLSSPFLYSCIDLFPGFNYTGMIYKPQK